VIGPATGGGGNGDGRFSGSDRTARPRGEFVAQGTQRVQQRLVTDGSATAVLALYGSAQLIRVSRNLHAARLDLADLAVRRERLRVSRDLHDLLGHSLSAVALKGDLALRLLESDKVAARREVHGLTEVAQATRRDMRAVVLDEHATTLRAEVDDAVAVLKAAGVHTTATLDAGRLSPSAEAVLGWAVREGATNVLRHSDADVCKISVSRADGLASLEIISDGVSGTPGNGTGLAGLRDRARTLSGLASGGPTGDWWFRLRVDVPEGEL
jgi:two-component system, NarL family, sensor histidine kinase DesK